MITPPENELRKMRDKVFGYQSQKEWESCRDKWAEDCVWLAREYAKVIAAEVSL